MEKIVMKQAAPAVGITQPNQYVEALACKFADGKGASVALFNHQVDHTAEQHYRKMYKHDEMILPGTADKVYDMNLTDKDESVLSFDFENPVDFKKYDEFVMSCRADGDMPGGGIWPAFFDESGKKAWWPAGQTRIGQITGKRWFERRMTPHYPNYSNIGVIKADDGFDWRRIKRIDLTLKRGKYNPPLRYKFHLKKLSLLNLLTDQKLEVKRENIPYKGKVEAEAALLGLDPEKTKVYAADISMNLLPVPAEIKDGKICFDAQVDGDWKEYLLKEE